MKTISNFTVIKQLGAGGFGRVYLAHDAATDRDVAIKTFEPSSENVKAFSTTSDEEGIDVLKARFQQEAQLLARLDNAPNIISVLSFGETTNDAGESIPYYVMPYVRKTLKELIGDDVFDSQVQAELSHQQKPKKLDYTVALNYFEQITKGIAEAHKIGLVHRDLKPSNIMLSGQNEIKIVDFGIAKSPDSIHSTLSRLGMGNRNYTAPEQRVSAKYVDSRADVYSLGVLAYRLFTGELPEGRFSDPNVLCKVMPAALNTLIVECLNQQKEQRPNDAGILLQQISTIKKTTTALDESETWTNESASIASTKPELKPLKDKIENLLSSQGELYPQDKANLQALATLANLGDAELNKFIDDVCTELKHNEPSFSGLNKWLQGLDTYFSSNKKIDKSIINDLLNSGQETTQLPIERLQSLMFKKQQQHGVSEVKSQQENLSPKSSKTLLASVVGVILTGGVGYLAYEHFAVGSPQKNDVLVMGDALSDGLEQNSDKSQSNEVHKQEESIGESQLTKTNKMALTSIPKEVENKQNDVALGKNESSTKQQVAKIKNDKPTERQTQLALGIDPADEKAWSQATKQNTARSYQRYIDVYPDGKYTADAKRTVKKQQAIAKQQAETEKKALVAQAALLDKQTRIAQDYLQRLGYQVSIDGKLGANTIKAIKRFELSNKLPEKGKVDKQLIALLLKQYRESDSKAWSLAKKENSKASYKHYLESHLEGEYRKFAVKGLSNATAAEAKAKKQKTEKEDKIAWKQVKRLSTLDAYENYLDEFPNAIYKKHALKAIKSLKAKQQEEEDRKRALKVREDKLAWKQARRARTESAYQAYLSKVALNDIPGIYKSHATKALNALHKKNGTSPRPANFVDYREKLGQVSFTMKSIDSGVLNLSQTRFKSSKKLSQVINRFYLAETETTWGLYQQCVEAKVCTMNNDSGFGKNDKPAINVSKKDIENEFLPWLNQMTGKSYRLPTEVEWEYAARAGSDTAYYFGDNPNKLCQYANVADSSSKKQLEDTIAANCDDGYQQTAPVKSYQANAFGLYDMHGNVWELSSDCLTEYKSGLIKKIITLGKKECDQAAARGGSWLNEPALANTSYRKLMGVTYRQYNIGFRLAHDFK